MIPAKKLIILQYRCIVLNFTVDIILSQTQIESFQIKEFREEVPTHSSRNSISKVTIRNNREILPSFGKK